MLLFNICFVFCVFYSQFRDQKEQKLTRYLAVCCETYSNVEIFLLVSVVLSARAFGEKNSCCMFLMYLA